jgi:hypothetical protein
VAAAFAALEVYLVIADITFQHQKPVAVMLEEHLPLFGLQFLEPLLPTD